MDDFGDLWAALVPFLGGQAVLGTIGVQTMVDHVDHPSETLVDVGVDLKTAGCFQYGESVQHAAERSEGVDLLLGST